MSLSLYGVPDGQQKGQSVWPCPSVYSLATALGSLSSVALSSAPAPLTLTQCDSEAAIQRQIFTHIWSGFLVEATNTISSGFLREATGNPQFRATKRHKKNFTKNSFVICFVPFCGYTNLKGDLLGFTESQQTALF
jgi:hypothetical protein